jgi:tetratricopeptide (TPR) repeat protein
VRGSQLIIANMISGLLNGDREFQKATKEIDRAIAAFTAAMVDLGSVCGVELVKKTTIIQDSICDLSLRFGEFVVNFENHLRICEDTEHDAKTLIRQVETGNALSQTEYYGVPFDRNSEFVGRKTILDSLFGRLNNTTNATKRVALFGLGGVGKTQIALEYLHCNSEKYGKVYWVAASDRSCIENGLANIAQQSGVPFKEDLPVSEVAGQMINWLCRNSGWLLILDGLDDITAIRGMLPGPPYHGHVIITTRNTHVRHIAAVGLEVTELSRVEAERLFLDISELSADDPKVTKEVQKIVEELGCLPLAITQAASFVRSSELYSFLTTFRSSRIRFLSDNPEGSHPYPRSIAATWSMSINQVPSRAQLLAEILAFLNGDEIQVSFLVSHNDSFEGDIQEILSDQFLFVKSLTALQGYSLVKVVNNGKTVVMHRLLQAVIRDNLAANRRTALQYHLLNLCEHTFQYSAFKDNSLDVRNFHRSVCPQILGILQNFDPAAYKNFALGELSDNLLDFLFDEAQYSQCKEVGERMLEERRQSFGADDARLLATQRGLAAVYSAAEHETFSYADTMDESKAIDLFKATLHQQTKVLGSEHPDTLWTKHGLAVAYSGVRKYQDALNLIFETYEARNRILGTLHMHTLRSKHFLAVVYDALGRHEDAQRHVEETVKNREETLGKEHLETLRSVLTLANIMRRKGEVMTARTLYQRVVKGRAEMLGVDHPHTVWARSDLLAFEQEQKEKDEILRETKIPGGRAENQVGQIYGLQPGSAPSRSDSSPPISQNHRGTTTSPPPPSEPFTNYTTPRVSNQAYQSYETHPWTAPAPYQAPAYSYGGTRLWPRSQGQQQEYQSYGGSRPWPSSWRPQQSYGTPPLGYGQYPQQEYQSYGGSRPWPPLTSWVPQPQSYGGSRPWGPAQQPQQQIQGQSYGGSRPWEVPAGSLLPPHQDVSPSRGFEQQSSGGSYQAISENEGPSRNAPP